jgi:hypothetical protein
MDQKRSRSEDMPNRDSSMEPAEGSRNSVNSGSSRGSGSRERGAGSQGERNRVDSGSSSSSSTTTEHSRNSGGITNRPLDREQCEQEQLPERGQSQSER